MQRIPSRPRHMPPPDTDAPAHDARHRPRHTPSPTTDAPPQRTPSPTYGCPATTFPVGAKQLQPLNATTLTYKHPLWIDAASIKKATASPLHRRPSWHPSRRIAAAIAAHGGGHRGVSWHI